MLVQRSALFALKLVCAIDSDGLKEKLDRVITLLEKSHNGLLFGDREADLPGSPSPTVYALYFEPPIDLDRRIRAYIDAARSLLAEIEVADQNNPHLIYMLKAADSELLEAIDTVVRQYQEESDALQRSLYSETQAAAIQAQAQAKQIEEAMRELQSAQLQLVQTEKMSSLGQLVAGIAHEINNPVNFIFGNLTHVDQYTQDILELMHLYEQHCLTQVPAIASYREEIDLDFLIEDLPKTLASMKTGADRIRKIVLSLRNFSRGDETEVAVVDIHEGIDSTLLILQHRLKPQSDRCDIQVVKEYGELPLVECYPGQLNQVFMNILSNAIDALECDLRYQGQGTYIQTPPTICICTKRSGDRVEIRIADNGEGMPVQVMEKLFQPFFTTKPVGKGTGLGMSISHQIVTEKHKGLLTCNSHVGKGTEFQIEIPLFQPK